MSFDPEKHGFKKISYTSAPGEVAHYELTSNEIELREYDMARLNVYLTQDRDFVNVWFGLLDAWGAEYQLGFADDQRLNFREIYDEFLFRGYIEDNETGKTILNALRIDRYSPQALRVDDEGKLECYQLAAA